MARLPSFFPPLNLKTLARGSRLRFGKNVRLAGVPAILAGVACIVLAAGVGQALVKGATVVPDMLREMRELLKTIRAGRRELNP